jgi:hypothetical protein
MWQATEPIIDQPNHVLIAEILQANQRRHEWSPRKSLHHLYQETSLSQTSHFERYENPLILYAQHISGVSSLT